MSLYVDFCFDPQKITRKPSDEEKAKVYSYAQTRALNNPIYMGDIQQYAIEIGENHHAFIPAIFKEPRRKKEFFSYQQLFVLDFDHDVTYVGIREKLKQYSFPVLFSYHSLRSSPDEERFRIVFLLDCKVDNINIAEFIITMLLYIFPEADRQCSDASHIYLGGKELIEYNECILPFMQILHVYYQCLKERSSSNYARNLVNMARKWGIGLTEDKKAFDIRKYDNSEEFLSTPNYNIVGLMKNSSIIEPVQYVYRNVSNNLNSVKIKSTTSEKTKSANKRRFARIKQAGRYCRLIDEFYNGVDIGHHGRFHLMTVFLQIHDGKRLFIETIRQTGFDYKKWMKEINSPDKRQYEHEQSCTKCQYYDNCDNEGTLIKTVEKRFLEDNPNAEVKLKHSDNHYINLEEGRKLLIESILNAITSPVQFTLIKAQTGIGKTHAYKSIIAQRYHKMRFIIACPTNKMKQEVYDSFINDYNIPKSDILISPSFRDNSFLLFFKDLAKEIDEFLQRGIYDETIPLIKKYMIDNKDSLSALQVEYLSSFLEFNKKAKKARIIIITHQRLSTMSSEILRDAIVVIDEDILVSSYFLNSRSVSVESVENAMMINNDRQKEVLHKVLTSSYDKIHYTHQSEVGGFFHIPTKDMNEYGIYGNVNDLLNSYCYYKDKNSNVIWYYRPGFLPDAKYIVLSATHDPEIFKNYFRLKDNQIKYVEMPLVKYKGRLIQYTAHPLGRSTLDEECLRRICSVYNDNYEVISFKKHQRLSGTPKIANDIYFSKCSGTNALKGKNIIVAGTPFVTPIQYKLIGAYLGRINDQSKQHMRNIEYGNYIFRSMSFEDKVLQRLQCYMLISEMEQAVGRARLISEPAEVVVYSTIPCEQAEYITKDYYSEYGITQNNKTECLNSA